MDHQGRIKRAKFPLIGLVVFTAIGYGTGVLLTIAGLGSGRVPMAGELAVWMSIVGAVGCYGYAMVNLAWQIRTHKLGGLLLLEWLNIIALLLITPSVLGVYEYLRMITFG